MIKRSKELKELDNPDIKNIFIAPDLTKKEREEQYKLKEELREKRDEGGKWIIKKDKAVKLDDTINNRNRWRE